MARRRTRPEKSIWSTPSTALDALKIMKPYTFVKHREYGQEADIFQNPVTGKGWHDERSQRDHYWKPALVRCGIKPRRAYCTRHTFCTVALMAGVVPAYIAQQAGHDLKMLEAYAKWLPGDDGGRERDSLRAAMRANSSPILPQPLEPRNEIAGKSLISQDLPASRVGSRDWTRTSRPRLGRTPLQPPAICAGSALQHPAGWHERDRRAFHVM